MNAITPRHRFYNTSLRPAWSGIETINARSADEALETAGLNWDVSVQPMYLGNGEKVPKANAITRNDNGSVLGVVGKQYRPIQNSESLSFFDDVRHQLPDFKYVSAGSIGLGKRVWLLADFGGFDAQSGDEVRKQILLFNSHDGSSSMSYVFVPVRLFCNNQIAMLLSQDKLLKIRHSQSAQSRIKQAQSVAGHAIENYSNVESVFKTLANTQLTTGLIKSSLDVLYPVEEAEGRTLTRRENTRREIVRLIDEGQGQHHPSTAFTLFNAFTEYFTHHTQANGENASERRWDNNLFGKGMRSVQKVTNHLILQAG